MKLWNYFFGYVIIKVKGPALEKFLNITVNQDIFLWDVFRIDKDSIQAKVCIMNFKKLKPIARKTKCRVFLVSKRGLPFTFHRIKKRKMLIAGACLFLVLLYVLSNVILSVEITGLESLDVKDIEKQLAEYGVKEGRFKFLINTSYIENQLLLKNDKISWAEIDIKGSRVLVKIVEKIVPPKIDEQTPCNIVAAKKGVIEEILPLKGDVRVKPGDTVREGQVLISGLIELEDKQTYFVHAQGQVTARIWHEETVKIPIVRYERLPTGRNAVGYKLKVGDKIINLKSQNITFKHYDKTITRKIIPYKFIQKFPIELVIETYSEVNEKKVFIGIEAAFENAKKIAVERLMKKLSPDAKILDKSFVKHFRKDENLVEVKVLIETLEEIGVERELNFVNES
ncbi:MAG: hypothetical protein PWP21_414 [Thermosediminibacterales bacterium]|nr:hypothetical protein [Thermosediminibacterales bacterium]